MSTIFSETLTRFRKEAGFSTAYRFYHGNGGQPVLKLSYRKYLLMEQGKLLPLFQRLHRIISTLRCVANSAPATELVVAWLKTMAGDEAFRDILEPLLPAQTEIRGLSPLHKSVRRLLTDKKIFITQQQFSVICANADNYLCYIAMSEDSGEWEAGVLAQKLKLKKNTIAKSLKELAAAKILKEPRKGFYTCPFAAHMVEVPQLDMLNSAIAAKYCKFRNALIASGSPVFTRIGVIRADAQQLQSFYPMLTLNLSTAATYAITERTDKSAIFAVIGKIVKIRDF
jgi:hypothetical protein